MVNGRHEAPKNVATPVMTVMPVTSNISSDSGGTIRSSASASRPRFPVASGSDGEPRRLADDHADIAFLPAPALDFRSFRRQGKMAGHTRRGHEQRRVPGARESSPSFTSSISAPLASCASRSSA